MSDNSEYRKESLGDGKNADIPASFGAEELREPQNLTNDSPVDYDRFYNYTLSSGDIECDDRLESDIPEEEFVPKKDVGIADDFDITFDFDKEYGDIPEERPLRQRREKRTGCVGGILFSVFVICISLLLASLGWLAATDVLGFGSGDEEVNVTVPEGFTIDEIAEMLQEHGLIKYQFLFKLYANFSKIEEKQKIAPGAYMLNTNYDYRALVSGMSARSGIRVETEVLFPEGYTMAQMFAVLEEAEVCSAEELWEAAAKHDFEYSFLDKSTLGDKRRLEGYLFPNKYIMYVGSTPQQALTKLLDDFDRKFTKDYTARAEELGYSIRDIITIASMIEREAGVDEDRDKIASVIYNRLNNKDFPHLQIDATIYYAIAGTDQKFSTDVDSPYNTYMCVGLPVGPISNPGTASIRAALYPASTQYYYYALHRGGYHEFFTSRSAHETFVKSDNYGG